jgi:hypothetical protein
MNHPIQTDDVRGYAGSVRQPSFVERLARTAFVLRVPSISARVRLCRTEDNYMWLVSFLAYNPVNYYFCRQLRRITRSCQPQCVHDG